MKPAKKILMITRNFPPLVGGMERLNKKIYEILSKEHYVTLLGPKGANKYSDSNDVIEFASSPIWLYLISSLVKAVRLSKRKYYLIFCGSGTAILAGFLAAKFSSAKLVCYLHGLDIVADSFFYQKVFIPVIKKADLLLVNSMNTQQLAISAGIDAQKIELLHPGVELPELLAPAESLLGFRSKFSIDNSPLIIIVGRLTQRKGIPEFIQNAMPTLVARYPDLKLLVIGGSANDAINKKDNVAAKIRETIDRLNLSHNIKCVGLLSEEDLNFAYASADVMVFPVLDLPGDVEGFGMVAVEGAARGTPTVAFQCGGVQDAIHNRCSGLLVPPRDYKSLVEGVIQYLDAPEKSSIRSMCIEFSKEFSWDEFEKKLNAIFEVKNGI